jgi:hypothetical protein
MTKERPILFSGPMIRAIRDGRKSMTRRIVKGVGSWAVEDRDDGSMWPGFQDEYCDWKWDRCPYGQAGDLLWVRETFWEFPGVITNQMLREGANTWPRVIYDADGDQDWCVAHGWVRKPSIFMRRIHSRFLLKLESPRVERLQDISEDDACSEGVELSTPDEQTFYGQFRVLWGKINGPDSWKANPWVWVLPFTVQEAGK